MKLEIYQQFQSLLNEAQQTNQKSIKALQERDKAALRTYLKAFREQINSAAQLMTEM